MNVEVVAVFEGVRHCFVYRNAILFFVKGKCMFKLKHICTTRLSVRYKLWHQSLSVHTSNTILAPLSKSWLCGRLLAVIAGSNPTRGGIDVCLLWVCALSGRDVCDGLITRPEDSYRLWCVSVRSGNLDNEEALAHWGGCCVMVRKSILWHWKKIS